MYNQRIFFPNWVTNHFSNSCCLYSKNSRLSDKNVQFSDDIILNFNTFTYIFSNPRVSSLKTDLSFLFNFFLKVVTHAI